MSEDKNSKNSETSDTSHVSNETINAMGKTIKEQQSKIAEQEELLKKKDKRKSPYKKWVQLDCDFGTDALFNLMTDCPPAAKIFIVFIKFMGTSNSIIVTNDLLQQLTGMKKSSVYTALSYLLDNGYIQRIPIAKSAFAYTISPQIVWKSYGDRVKTAEFTAKVIVDAKIDGKKITEYLKKQKRILVPVISNPDAENSSMDHPIEEPEIGAPVDLKKPTDTDTDTPF